MSLKFSTSSSPFSLRFCADEYSEPCQTSKMESDAKLLTIFTKHSHSHVSQGSEYASDICHSFIVYRSYQISEPDLFVFNSRLEVS